jgi:dTDP-glucose 4,6-dehydratase
VRVLITGAAGFLGSHLADRFLREGHAVVGLDNFVTGHPDNIAHLIGSERFEFVRHNISTFTFVAGTLDGVLHFASPASPVDYLEHPIPTLQVGAPKGLGFSWRRRRRCTATRWSTPKRSGTGAT